MHVDLSKIRSLLRATGLTVRQVQLYLHGLRHGPHVVTDYATALKINRQQTYAELERLVDAGAMEGTGTRPRRYFAVSPEQLVRREEERQAEHATKIDDLRSHLDLFRSLQQETPESAASITNYQGKVRVRQAYERELVETKGTEVCSLVGSLEAHYQLLPEDYWDTWNKRFAKQRSSCRMIVHPSASAKRAQSHDREARRETRTLKEFDGSLNIDIFGPHVLLVSAEEQLALWIESPAIARSYRLLFETLWRVSQP